MENKLTVFKSDRFDLQDASYLSLFLYPNSIQIFAKDKNESNLCIHSYQDIDASQLEKLILSDPLLRLDLPAQVFVHSPNFSLVPGMLYQQGKEDVYLEFAGSKEENPFYFTTALDSNNLQVVSSISGKLNKTLNSRFSELSYYHGSVSILSYLFKERFNLLGQEILVYIFEKKMYAAAFTDQELSVFNLFQVEGLDDILKYIFILIKQLEFDSNHVRVSVFNSNGIKEIGSDWGKSYFKNFRLIEASANQNYTHGFKNLKQLNLFEINWQYC